MERDSFVVKNLSFLRARDPSIINNHATNYVRNYLADQFSNLGSNNSEDKDECMKIFLRIKNISSSSSSLLDHIFEIKDKMLICNVPDGSQAMRNARNGDCVTKTYQFSEIFGPEASQTDIFNSVVKPKIFHFINGHNSTLLTYGASGSGKTFTVTGTSNDPGLIPRSLEYLFRTIEVSDCPVAKPLPHGALTQLDANARRKERQITKTLSNFPTHAQHTNIYRAMQTRLSDESAAHIDNSSEVYCEIWVSFAEIYNESIYDLLQTKPPVGKPILKLRLGSWNGKTYIKDLSSVNVTTALEAYQILQYGIQNLNYAATKVNDHSSRSHSIFTVKLIQISRSTSESSITLFNFCDLAGSERSKKTENVGLRLAESNNINSSLLVLGRCIKTIRENQKQNDKSLVPFRESKLTQLFQKALGGEEDIAMIVTISPSKNMFDETHHVLNFSSIAKSITITNQEEIERNKRQENRFSRLLEDLSTQSTDEGDDFHNREIEQYQNMITSLELELARREELANCDIEQMEIGYKKIWADTEKMWEKKLKRKCKDIRNLYEAKINSLKEELDKYKKGDIINLDSSSSESEGNGDHVTDERANWEEEKRHLWKIIKDAQELYTITKAELVECRQQVQNLEAEKSELSVEMFVLRRDLERLQCDSDDVTDESAQAADIPWSEILNNSFIENQ